MIYHDESTFHANDGQAIAWAEEGRVSIRPKTQRKGLMVSDFVTEHHGLLQLTYEEYQEAQHTDPSIKMCAKEIIKFGADSEGYWNNQRMLEKATKIAEIKYPSDEYNIIWKSSGHCAFREDALNVNQMNLKPGGAQPRLRDTYWNGKLQKMNLPDGRPKGLNLVLQECGIDTHKMKLADMRLVLGIYYLGILLA